MIFIVTFDPIPKTEVRFVTRDDVFITSDVSFPANDVLYTMALELDDVRVLWFLRQAGVFHSLSQVDQGSSVVKDENR